MCHGPGRAQHHVVQHDQALSLLPLDVLLGSCAEGPGLAVRQLWCWALAEASWEPGRGGSAVQLELQVACICPCSAGGV